MTPFDDTPALRADGLGKCYGSKWALADCTFSVPQGRVTALVGPNGAGKTTLLRLLVGLTSPSAGHAEVLGRRPVQSQDFLSSIGYLAQDVPLYGRLTADDHLGLGAHLNRDWDERGAIERLEKLRVPMDRPVGKLSGGQRAQIGLGLALAKRPQVLLLDEPVAALDPLARRDFLSSLTEAVAEGNLSVILSSHLLHDLERVCDHVILLAESRTQLCDDIDRVLASHCMLVGPRKGRAETERSIHIIKATHTTNQTRLVVRVDGPLLDPSWERSDVGLEDVILAYMGQEAASEGHLSVMGGAA